jgi:hypothetical protein
MNKIFRILILINVLGLISLFAEQTPPEESHAYMMGSASGVDDVKLKLQSAGFEVIGAYAINEAKQLTTVIYTNAALKSMANQEGRGFVAIGRVLVNGETGTVSLSNPVYFGKAFMQKDADFTQVAAHKQALENAFGKVEVSADKLEYDDLEDYHFMMSMPYYEDSDELAEGKNADLLAKAEASPNHLFTLTLSEGRHLVGMKLSPSTSEFPLKVGVQNAGLLPYTVLIEEDKAISMASKYYIAVSYPMLSMGDFMAISDVPDIITEELEAVFK